MLNDVCQFTFTAAKLVQPLNTELLIEVTALGMLTAVNALQSIKALLENVVTVPGTITAVKPLHSRNPDMPIEVTV
jgi:hypothetical protein